MVEVYWSTCVKCLHRLYAWQTFGNHDDAPLDDEAAAHFNVTHTPGGGRDQTGYSDGVRVVLTPWTHTRITSGVSITYLRLTHTDDHAYPTSACILARIVECTLPLLHCIATVKATSWTCHVYAKGRALTASFGW